MHRSRLRSALALSLLLVPVGAAAQSPGSALPPPKPFTDDLVIQRPAPQRDLYGYPALDVDRERILSLLRERRFADLEALLNGLRDRVHEDIRWEDHLVASYGSFQVFEGEVESLLDEWVTSSRGSAAPYIARAMYFTARAWRVHVSERGDGRERMKDAALRSAWSDAERAAEVDPANLAAYDAMLAVMHLYGTADWQKTILDRALTVFPTSYALRFRALLAMKPSWGGRYGMMRDVADAAQSHLPENPRLRTLRGTVALAEGEALYLDDRLLEAFEKSREASRYGSNWELHSLRAAVYNRTRDYVRALEELNRAAALRPDGYPVLEMRGRILGRLAEEKAPPERRVDLLEAAAVDLAEAVPFDPDPRLMELHARVVGLVAACTADESTCFEPRTSPKAAEAPGERMWIEDVPWLFKPVLLLIGVPVVLVAMLMQV